jgi:hypothetical protein
MEEFEFKIGLLKGEDLEIGGEAHSPKIVLMYQHLKAILDVVELVKDEKEVAIDGFRFLGEETIYPLKVK